MIHQLEIENFKSLKHVKLECRKVNIFIGEPNTGKSNILESVGIFSFPYGDLHDFVRIEKMSNLFYDENLDDAVKIKTDERILEIVFQDLIFEGICHTDEEKAFQFSYGYEGRGPSDCPHETSPFKFYKFMVRKDFSGEEASFLLPPSGMNLFTVLMTHKQLKSAVSDLFAPFGLRLIFKPQENKIEVLKQYEDIFISLPYSLVSETLQRIVFYFAAISSNEESILIFEEPEPHAFPYYTKFLAERIALDKNNQYFISTHNPYFLLSVLEKTPRDEIKIFITYFEDYQTKVKPLEGKELQEVMDMGIDIFFNIERFVEGHE